jgi:hypothetical protein
MGKPTYINSENLPSSFLNHKRQDAQFHSVSDSLMLRPDKEEREKETDVRRSSSRHGTALLSARLMILI